MLHYRLTVLFAGERICKIGKYLAKLQAKWLIASHAVYPALSCLKVQISPDNLRNAYDVQQLI